MMQLDYDTSGIEDAQKQLDTLKSYRPFCSTWFAVKVNGDWGCYDTAGKVTRAIAKASTVCPTVLYGQALDLAVFANRFKKAIEKRLQGAK